jgi:hypothetical protein
MHGGNRLGSSGAEPFSHLNQRVRMGEHRRGSSARRFDFTNLIRVPCPRGAFIRMPTRLTDEIITAAIRGFEEQKRHIDEQIAELRSTLSGGPGGTGTAPGATAGKRSVSAAARRRMALGQQARWARIRGEAGPAAGTPKPPKRKRRLSEAGRANIVAALKKRWAAKKAPAKAKPAAAKKAAAKKTAARKTAAKKTMTTAPAAESV